MMLTPISSKSRTTPFGQVVPFYLYAAMSLLAATWILALHPHSLEGHHFHPKILAITHAMALGWGTMTLFGASHQLLPVLLDSPVESPFLAYGCFFFGALGIPLLVYGFYQFDLGVASQIGAVLVNLAVLFYWVNVIAKAWTSAGSRIYAWFLGSACTWLLATTLLGLLLLLNFRYPLLSTSSLTYLSLHAHLGILGWFSLMVIGVGSRLFPLFLLSSYRHQGRLWELFIGVHLALASLIIISWYALPSPYYLIPLILAAWVLLRFVAYLYYVWKKRLRKRLDLPMRVSFAAIWIAIIPLIILLCSQLPILTDSPSALYMVYGFAGFFGWISFLLLGMTFKTLPFIVWMHRYAPKQGKTKTPMPKDLVPRRPLRFLYGVYGSGFVVCLLGQIVHWPSALRVGAILLGLAALIFVILCFQIVFGTVQAPKKTTPNHA